MNNPNGPVATHRTDRVSLPVDLRCSMSATKRHHERLRPTESIRLTDVSDFSLFFLRCFGGRYVCIDCRPAVFAFISVGHLSGPPSPSTPLKRSEGTWTIRPLRSKKGKHKRMLRLSIGDRSNMIPLHVTSRMHRRIRPLNGRSHGPLFSFSESVAHFVV